MNRKMKETIALALAVGMAVTGSTASYASGLVSVTIEDVAISTSSVVGMIGGSQSPVLIGTIKVTSISVKVLVAAAFEMNPNLAAIDPQVNQITAQSDEYKITGTSTVPINVSIMTTATNVAGDFTNGTAKLTGTENDKKAMFIVGRSIEAVPISATEDKTKRFDPDVSYGNTPHKVNTTAGDNTLVANAVLGMKLYGATVQGWSNNETFTAAPTFIIPVH